MTQIINPKPRFGLENNLVQVGDEVVDQSTLYDYVTHENVPLGTLLQTPEGVWDTARVAQLIRGGHSIEAALSLAVPSIVSEELPVQSPEVAVFKEEFLGEETDASAGDGSGEQGAEPAPKRARKAKAE